MCVMVISSSERLPSILEKLNDIDVSHLYYHNTQAGGLGVPFASLVPFANLVECEDAALEASDFRTIHRACAECACAAEPRNAAATHQSLRFRLPGSVASAALGVLMLFLVSSTLCHAAHPLITDDTGTQGKGKLQVELNYEFDHDSSGGIRENVHQIETVLSYGIVDSLDLVVGLPYQFIRTREDGVKSGAEGFSDVSLELKWRFWECGGFSLAAKPGLSIPTGDDDEGLGAGRVGGSFFLIATQELDPWTFHFNAGYGRNENTADEETDLWHVSLATEFEAAKWLRLVANVGAERNPDKTDDTPAAFALGGMIFSVTESLDLDVGVKAGLTEPEVDYALLAGAAYRF